MPLNEVTGCPLLPSDWLPSAANRSLWGLRHTPQHIAHLVVLRISPHCTQKSPHRTANLTTHLTTLHISPHCTPHRTANLTTHLTITQLTALHNSPLYTPHRSAQHRVNRSRLPGNGRAARRSRCCWAHDPGSPLKPVRTARTRLRLTNSQVRQVLRCSTSGHTRLSSPLSASAKRPIELCYLTDFPDCSLARSLGACQAAAGD